MKRKTATKRITGRRLQRLRKTLFDQQPLCVECLKHDRVREATQRDHKIPLSQGGTESDDNVQGLCDACHDAKSALERNT